LQNFQLQQTKITKTRREKKLQTRNDLILLKIEKAIFLPKVQRTMWLRGEKQPK